MLTIAAVARWFHPESRNRVPWGRVALVSGLLVLAPICAEYLSAYDSSTGQPVQLVAGMVIFIPLYGCSALVIREVARRTGLGWVGIVMLATAFGLVQAGVVDQSLFSVDYRGINGWEEAYQATLVAPLGISASNALNFVGGHVVFSICTPIALIEGTAPRRAVEPWLGRVGLALAALIYLGASGLVLIMSQRTEDSHASVTQVVVSLGVVVALVVAAPRFGRPRSQISVRSAPRIRTAFVFALVLSAVHGMATETWPGAALVVATFVVGSAAIVWGSRRGGWSVGHIAAVAGAPLLVRAALAFTYAPMIGTVSDVEKFGHNVVMMLIVLGATVLAMRSSAPVHVPPPVDVNTGSVPRVL